MKLETLRLYPIAATLPKSTNSAQKITYRNQTIDIPANTTIQIDIVTVQRSSALWGSDSQVFRPSRWLMPSDYIPPPNTTNESTAHTALLCPPKGAFIAFSAGFRAC
jgi:cytochrome P450